MSLLKPRGVEWVFTTLFGMAVTAAVFFALAGFFMRQL